MYSYGLRIIEFILHRVSYICMGYGYNSVEYHLYIRMVHVQAQ